MTSGSWADHPDVYFTPGYGRAECRPPRESWLGITCYDGLFQLPLVVRAITDDHRDAGSPYGYSGAYADPALSAADLGRAWAHVYEVLREQRVVSVFLRHSPLVPQAPLPSPNTAVVRDHPTVAVDVRDLQAAWSGLQGRCRTAIRKARSHGVTVDIGPATADDLLPDADFRRLYEATMQRRAAAAFYYFDDHYYAQLRGALGDDLLLGRARDADGTVISAALFLRHGGLLHYHLSGSGPEARRLGATNLLVWAAAEHCSPAGVELLHLGGGTGRDDPLYRFKASFGPRRLAYQATGLVIDPAAYDRLTKDAPDGATSTFFPAYRAA